jgi:hypothetical protein
MFLAGKKKDARRKTIEIRIPLCAFTKYKFREKCRKKHSKHHLSMSMFDPFSKGSQVFLYMFIKNHRKVECLVTTTFKILRDHSHQNRLDKVV